MTNTDRFAHRITRTFVAAALGWGLSHAALAAPPVVSTVPVDPNDPIQPHDIISGKVTTLKGAVDIASVGATWTWNPGDGSPTVSGVVMPTATSFAQTDDANFTPYYAIWIPHTYTGSDGDVILATLTVENALGEADAEVYRMEVRDVTLPVEVNVAIDESLWFMHRNMFRFDGAVTQGGGANTAGAVPMGRWDFQQASGQSVQGSVVGAAINAFEANGYLENGPASSPYTDTVARGLRYLIANLSTVAVSTQTFNRPAGSPDDADANDNLLGAFTNGVDPPYQTGMVLDAIVASGAPGAIAITGPATIIGRTYGDIVQDMVDWYAYAQTDSGTHGGWQYGAFNNTTGAHDNSASGWAAIGLLAAEDLFGSTVPDWVKTRNMAGLELTDNESATADTDGAHGYTSTGQAWGYFGTSAAAMVQMSLDDIQATTSLTPDERWIRSENFFRRHFNDAASGNNFKNYYYAMFNFAKAMRTAVPEEVVLIGANVSVGCGMRLNASVACGGPAQPLDWYLDPTSGLARVIVDDQTTSGSNIGMFEHRTGDSAGTRQDDHTTAWATQILTRTLFQAGPVARARATPNPGAANSPIAFDATESFHQDPARSLVTYQWDFDNDGAFDTSGALAQHAFDCPTLPVPCSYQVRLRVTDDNVPTRFDDDIVVVEITIPPRPPTAVAGGPYLVCLNEQFALDGSGSFDVDEGTSESGGPPVDTITAYGWELDSVSPFDFDEATGVSPTVSFAAPGVRDVGLRVTDNTALAFPTAAQPNLTDSDFGTVNVVDCGCIGPVEARSKPGKNQLTWAAVPGAAGYDILRSTVGPSQGMQPIKANHVSNYATYLDAGLTNGQTYWYRVRPLDAQGVALCAASLPVAGTPQTDRRARPDIVEVPNVVGLHESQAADALVQGLLAVGAITRVNDPVVPEGDVISQNPPAGANVVESTPVALVISLGPVLVEVPDLIGDERAAAEAEIVSAGLVVGVVTEANSDTVAAGRVISQDPIGGLNVVQGSVVSFVVSLGPQLVAVPNVVGATQGDATAAITGAGLALGAVATQNDDTVPAGSVLSQDPAAGTNVVLGTSVDIVVSLGPVTVAVPNVIGDLQADAASEIVAAGLVVGTVATQNSATVPAGHVITQSPGAGSLVLPGSAVDLTVSLGAVQAIVPNVVALAQAAAEAAIVAADLTVGTITTQNSLTVAAGAVITQSPDAGTSVPEGSTVDLVISLGPTQVGVPNVIGAAQAVAEGDIVIAHLVVGTITTTTHPTIAAGLVISQSPDPGQIVDEGSAVNIVVSLGPAAVIVPQVVGLAQGDAANAIVAADLVVGTVTNATSPTVPAGSVISQSPAGGASAPEGSAVNLVVSTGPAQVTVPDVVGDPQADAQAAITAAGLAVGTVTPLNSDTVPTGNIIDQSPAAGATVNEGSAVNLFVSLGPADVSVPNVVGQSQVGAQATLNAVGLVLGTVTEQPSATVPAGDVISQNPSAGTDVGAGTAVSIVVSSGPPADAIPPTITGSFNASPPNYAQGANAVLSVAASDNSGVVTLSGTLDGAPLAVNTVTNIPTATLAFGAHTVVVTATDPGGLTDSDSLQFFVTNPADGSAPTALITAPPVDGAVSAAVNVLGTADDANLVKYELQLAPAGTADFLTFFTGTTPVIASVLGELDPTTFANGIYELRLRVQDVGGNTATTQRPIRIDNGSNAPGAFRLEFTDLSVPVAGLPLVVKRIYDSRERGGKGDFGFGWHMEVVKGGRYENNRKPGDGWTITNGGFLQFCTVESETKVHVTEIRFSDTEFYRFKLNAAGDGTLQSGGCAGTVSFSQIGGVPGSTLTILDSNEVFYFNGGNELSFSLFDDRFGEVYDPEAVRLTTIDGRQFDFNQQGTLTRIRDLNNNILTFSANSISHNSGTGLTFVRDGQGRITSLTAPNGTTRTYTYDARGDLTAAADFMSNATQFAYDAGHLIEGVIDPLGNMPIRYEYDAAGRVTAQIDADGLRTEIDTNVAAGETSVTDRLGTIRTFSYDTRGNVTEATDGEATVMATFDARGNKLTEVDPLGNTRSFTYDASDNLLSETDALGNVTSYSYAAGGRPAGILAPLGVTMSFGHSAQGNPTSVTNGAGVVVQQFVNNAKGDPTQVTTLGGTVNFTYDALGRVTRRQGPGAVDIGFTYDTNGRQLTQTVVRTVSGAPVNETTSYTYNANGQILTKTDPLGNVTSFGYDAAGRRVALTDPNGNTTQYSYDKRGNVIRTDYPNGTFDAFTYDEENRRTAMLDRAGRTTFYEFDRRGNLLETLYPDGTSVENTYDLANRLLTSTNPLNGTTTYTYDDKGRMLTQTNPLAETTSYEYNALGALTMVTDPLGHATTMSYDHSTLGAPRLETTMFADTSSRLQTYAPSGRVSSFTDENGNTTAFTYDGSGNLLTVTDALAKTTSYAYDQAGNRISETDANGRVTTMTYDANRRPTSRTRPTGEQETFAYDNAGNLLTHTNFNGEVISFEYDNVNRLVEKTLPGGATVTYAYTPTDRVATITDTRGVTTYAYDSMDRVTSIAYPGGDTLAYTYDLLGNRTSVAGPQGTTTYLYDLASRLTSVTDPNGLVTAYTYDAAGNTTLVAYPNGTQTQYSYDDRNRMTGVQVVGPGAVSLLGHTYTLDAVGNRTQVVEAPSGRTVQYAYDDVYRLLQETDNVGGAPVATSYTYDNVGNRLTMNVGGVLTSYTYDLADRLISEGGFSYTYDDNGNLTGRSDGVTYAYDSEDRLVSRSQAGDVATYTYDDLGNRVQSSSGGVVTNYVVDPHNPTGLPQVVAEENGAGVLTRSYVYGRDLIGQRQGGVNSFYHADALGSTRALSDGAGTVTDTYDYTAFGSLADSSGSTANLYRFAGEQLDPASDLYYLRARYMDPRIGRFMSTDPFSGDVNVPTTLHNYLYAGNNPVNVIDPTGRFGMVSVSFSISIASTLSSLAIVSYGVYNEIQDIKSKVETLLTEIPGLPLNKELTAQEIRQRIIEIQIGSGGVDLNLDANLGGGSVAKAFDISADLVGTGGQQLAWIYAFGAGEWVATLPRVDGKPGNYLSCPFNAYVADTYKLQLLNGGIKGATLKPVLRVIGMWLNYFNLIALMGSTLNDSGGHIPAPPPSGACPISSAL